MKNYLLFIFLMLFSFPVLAADGTDPDFDSIFKSFGAFAAALPFITEALKKSIKPPKGLWTQVLSWGAGLAVAVFGYIAELGIFADIVFYKALLIGAAGSLISNGVFKTGIVTYVLKKLGILKNGVIYLFTKKKK